MADEVDGSHERSVWEDVYRRQYASTVRLAGLLLGDCQAGEDIAQEAFAPLFEVDARVTDLPAYLRGIVVNLCRSRIRRAILVRRHHGVRIEVAPGPDEAADLVSARIALRTALGTLSSRQREAVVLRFFGDMTEPEIAVAMGVSAGTVKTHLHRAMRALSQRMEALR